MPAPGNSAGTHAAVDWSATDLGARATWHPALQLAVDLVQNTPLPMLLLWGPRQITVFNAAFADFAGQRPGSVPGGFTPPVLPPLLGNLAGALAQAQAGASLHLARQPLDALHSGAAQQREVDIHLTPVPDGSGPSGGVLITLAPATGAPALADSGSLRILVVEDNLDSQYLVCEMLKAFGHDADGIGHAEGALTMLTEQHYDVLFSDVSLPGMSGVELARLAIARQSGLRVIFASGYGDALLRHLDFPYLSMQKPYELDQLQQALLQIGDELMRSAGHPGV